MKAKSQVIAQYSRMQMTITPGRERRGEENYNDMHHQPHIVNDDSTDDMYYHLLLLPHSP